MLIGHGIILTNHRYRALETNNKPSGTPSDQYIQVYRELFEEVCGESRVQAVKTINGYSIRFVYVEDCLSMVPALVFYDLTSVIRTAWRLRACQVRAWCYVLACSSSVKAGRPDSGVEYSAWYSWRQDVDVDQRKRIINEEISIWTEPLDVLALFIYLFLCRRFRCLWRTSNGMCAKLRCSRKLSDTFEICSGWGNWLGALSAQWRMMPWS